MAEKKLKPVIRLSEEQKRKLTETGDDVARAEHGIQVLKDLGMDVSELEGKLAWAKKARETLLREF